MRSEAFITGQDKVAAFVAGYTGTIKNHYEAINGLQASGYDVVGYEYDDSVLSDGNPQDFYDLISLIEGDFNARAATYKARRYSGVSFGSAIGINLQKRAPGSTEPGIYAVGGADIAKMIFHNLYFRSHKKAFVSNGFSESTLRECWQELHKPPVVSFAMVLGGLDYLVQYREAAKRFSEWERAGGRISVITRPLSGHSGAMEWFNQNIPTMLAAADGFVT